MYVVRETPAAPALSSTLTASKPRSLISASAVERMVRQASSFLRSRSPMTADRGQRSESDDFPALVM